jgi:hypothetical protein
VAAETRLAAPLAAVSPKASLAASSQYIDTPCTSPACLPQKEKFATGLDTGCVYGGQLTAAVLPPPDAAPAKLRAKLAAGEAPTLEDLRADLVSVDAEKEHAPPKKGKDDD